MFDWDDLRYFLAVARDGSTVGAARSLGVNQSTVQRRISALESALGRDLAVRHATGYRLTEFGELFLPYARSVEDAVLAAQVAARGLAAEASGIVRLTCPEPVLARIVASGLLDAFAKRHPAITLDFATADKYLDLWRSEADLALRSGEPEDPRLVGRKVADSFWAVYASQGYVRQHGRPTPTTLDSHTFIAFDGPMKEHRVNQWLQSALPRARIATRCASVLGVMSAVKAGIGIAPLPTAIAAEESSLVVVVPAVPELTRGWYLLTRPDFRTEPRIAAVFDFLIAELPKLRAALTG